MLKKCSQPVIPRCLGLLKVTVGNLFSPTARKTFRYHRHFHRKPPRIRYRFLSGLLAIILILPSTEGFSQRIPSQVLPRRSYQLVDGFGMNVDLPREPGLPWTERWWTRIFDSGIKWVRIGQYENSSDQTSWDWVEQTPGHYAATPDLDEAIRSLAENGVHIEMELQYSNPLYQGNPAARPPRVILPPPGIGPDDHPPNPIFTPPTSAEQIEAFLRYAHFMVSRYKGEVKYWELWNEPDIGYWQPQTKTRQQLVSKAKAYGRLMSRFADVVHKTDPQAKVISAGTSSPNLVFVQAALAQSAPKVDIVAYHTYPGFGSNHMPEEADTLEHASAFRAAIMHLPGMRNETQFWDNEWDVSPHWKNSNESVQARYVPRFYLYNLAQRVKGFMWELVPSTDGNEDNLYGIINGKIPGANAFKPRAAYRAFEVTSALFGETVMDPMAEFSITGVPARYTHGQLQSYAFRDKVTGQHIYAFWLAVIAEPADHFTPVDGNLKVSDPDLHRPVLIDVRTGAVKPLRWEAQGNLRVPLKDSVMAVTDASYLNWPLVPETPGELQVLHAGKAIRLRWKTYSPADRLEIERSVNYGPWKTVAEIAGGQTAFQDTHAVEGHVTYRLRAYNGQGPSAWSNPAWVDVKNN